METNEEQDCPICYRKFPITEIEVHVNKCLFLNSADREESQCSKRKRTSSPSSPSLLNKSNCSLTEKTILLSDKKRKDIKNISNCSTVQSKSNIDTNEVNSDNSNDSFEFIIDEGIYTENNPKNIISTNAISSGSNSSESLSELVKHIKVENIPNNKISGKQEIHPFFTSTFHSTKTINKINRSPTKPKQSPTKVQQKTNPVKQEITEVSNKNIKIENKGKETIERKISFITPLAKQLQPKSLDEFVGQNHVFGENSVLRTLLSKGEIPNMILWGPPGSGKTSLAGVIQDICKKESKRLRFVSLCAANAGVKDVQTIVTTAKNELKFGRQTVLFMDEIHRFNKKQQDTFLIHVEKGEIILIGATTENPSFSINNALLSRCRVIVFEKLDSDALVTILINAINNLDIDLIEDDNPIKYDCNKEITKLSIEKSALVWLADTSDGDARIALNNLQLVLQHNTNKICVLCVEHIQEEIKKSHLLYDRKGEEHYNLISALHKSIRASDDNAALYWCTRMIISGEDPLYIARRLVRAASEDIGNSDPNALQLAVSTMQGCQLLGMPECDVLLSQCAIYLARAPKSREADTALAEAKHYIKNFEGPQPNVPMHLRNAPRKLMQDLGYGQLKEGSSYHCMPEGCEDVKFF